MSNKDIWAQIIENDKKIYHNMRVKKLATLIKEVVGEQINAEELADRLVSAGVEPPLVRKGDTVYMPITTYGAEDVLPLKVTAKFTVFCTDLYDYVLTEKEREYAEDCSEDGSFQFIDIGHLVFLTEREAWNKIEQRKTD